MNVRALIMMTVGIAGAFGSVWRPYLGLLLLVFLYFFRPDLWGAEAFVKPVEWLTIAVFLGWLVHEKAEASYRGTGWLLLLLGLYAASCLFGPFASDESWSALEATAKVFVAVFLIIKLCDTPQRLAGLILVFIAGMLWFLKVVLLSWSAQGFSGGVRIDTAIGEGGGANYIAWALATMLPFVLYKAVKGRLWQRWAAIGLVPFWLAGLVATGSRGGLLCLAASTLVFLLLVRQKAAAVGVAVVAISLMAIAPEEYWERASTITTNPEEMDASALTRHQNMLAGRGIIHDYPMFGTGLATFPKAKLGYVGPDYIGGGTVAHNTYIQMASEVGLPFLLVFLAINAWLAWQLSRRIRGSLREEDADPLEWIRIGILAGLASTAVQMVKGDMARGDLFWWLYGVGFVYVRLRNEYAGAAKTAQQPRPSAATDRPMMGARHATKGHRSPLGGSPPTASNESTT